MKKDGIGGGRRKEMEVEEWCGKKRDGGTLSRQTKKGKRKE